MDSSPGHTGAPGEGTCAASDCHDGADLVSPPSIRFVTFGFRNGPEPVPCEAAADVNCDGVITAADVIHMVNVLFKVAVPCDVCPLIWAGTWTCE